MTPQEEAAQIFWEVIQSLTSGAPDLKIALRRSQHACQLIGWNDNTEWFKLQLDGYPTGTPIPEFRKVRGVSRWRPAGYLEAAFELTPLGEAQYDLETEPAELDVFAGLDWLMEASQSGYTESTGDNKEGYQLSRSIKLERVRIFAAANFQTVVSTIETEAFGLASRAYTLLRYGNAIADIWSEHRTEVDATLRRLDLGSHLDAIQVGLQSDNPEACRNAVFGARNLMNDLAEYLWRDKRTEYEFLPGDGPNGKLNVGAGRSKNRLSAYLHQKGFTGARGSLMRNELERLADSAGRLIELQSRAHSRIRKEDARSVILATDFILGEMVTKTDMVPVEVYQQPDEN